VITDTGNPAYHTYLPMAALYVRESGLRNPLFPSEYYALSLQEFCRGSSGGSFSSTQRAPVSVCSSRSKVDDDRPPHPLAVWSYGTLGSSPHHYVWIYLIMIELQECFQYNMYVRPLVRIKSVSITRQQVPLPARYVFALTARTRDFI